MKPPPAVFTATSAGPALCAAATVASPATHAAINSTHPKTQNGFRMERFTVLLLCELNYASPETGQAKPRARPATLPRSSDKVVKDLSRGNSEVTTRRAHGYWRLRVAAELR